MTEPVNPVLGSRQVSTLRTTLLDRSTRESFDRLIRLAIKILNVPVAFVLIRDEDQFVVRSQIGLSEFGQPAADAATWYHVWQAVLSAGEPLMISDIGEHSLSDHDPAITRAGIVALLGVPLTSATGYRAGILCLGAEQRRSWTSDEMEILSDLVAPVMAEIELRAAVRETGGEQFCGGPGERTKELTALHAIAGLLHAERPVPEVLAAVAPILQSAWQFPEITGVRLQYDAGEYATPNFRRTPWMQVVEFRVDGTRGLIEVAYLEERSPEYEGPFLAQERDLIDSAAMLLRSYFDRQRMERGLQASHQRTSDILECISDAFYAVDEEWRFTYVNRKAEQLWRRRREDLIGKVIWEEFPEAVGSGPYEAPGRAARERLPVRFEAVSPITHGWIEGDVYPGSSGLSVYFRDISERKRSEEALRGSEARLRTIFEGAAIGIALVDVTGRIVQGNGALCDLLGYTETELRGRSFMEVTHPDDAALDWNLFTELVDGRREQYQIEKRYIHKDGRVVWGRLTVSLSGDAGDSSAYFIKMVEDITWQKRAEQALRESEERLQSVNALAGQASIGLDGKLLKVNQVCCEISGYDEAELLATDFQSIAHPDDRAAGLDYLRQVLAGRGPSSPVEKRCVRKDGSIVTALISASVVRDAEGTPQSLICLVLDITERKRAEEEREQLLIREQVARAEAEAAQQRIAFLAGASQFLADSLDYEATLENIAQLAIPVLADWCTVRILQPDGTLRSLAAAHADPEKMGLIRQLPEIVSPLGPDRSAKEVPASPLFTVLETS